MFFTGAQGVWKEAYHSQSLLQSHCSLSFVTNILGIYCWKCEETVEAELKIAVKM